MKTKRSKKSPTLVVYMHSGSGDYKVVRFIKTSHGSFDYVIAQNVNLRDAKIIVEAFAFENYKVHEFSKGQRNGLTLF